MNEKDFYPLFGDLKIESPIENGHTIWASLGLMGLYIPDADVFIGQDAENRLEFVTYLGLFFVLFYHFGLLIHVFFYFHLSNIYLLIYISSILHEKI